MKPIARILCLCLVLGFAQAARADQNDERLGPLFQSLRETTNLAEGVRLTDEIWAIWLEGPSAEIDKLMAEGRATMAQGMQAAAREHPDMARERYDKALAIFDRMIEEAPDFAEGWNKRATLYYAMGEFDASVRDVEQTLILEPRHFGALSGLGLINLALGDDEAAGKAFEAALEVNPHLLGARLRLGEIRKRLGGEEI